MYKSLNFNMSEILSQLSASLVGSEIVKLGGEIREKIRQGEKIYNFTVGDFDPTIFPIPKALENEIVEAYRQHFTNYPAAEGNLDLREAIAGFVKGRQGLDYATDEILVASGGRPLIYALYRIICDKGDKVIYPVPSWNNNHYTHFVAAEHVLVEAQIANNFMPTAEQIEPHLKTAGLIALCSPQNPTGTCFSKEDLMGICKMVVEENERRGPAAKKLYLMYDQMYWQLTFGKTAHVDPVTLYPAMRGYTIYIDAVSKVFAATGVRVGWAFGPKEIIAKMKAFLTHLGAWAPMAEQKGLARFLQQNEAIDQYLHHFKKEVEERLSRIYNGLINLKQLGYAVNAIAPQAAIYLTVQFDFKGKHTKEGNLLTDQAAVTAYLLNEAKLAVVPFYAFGAPKDSSWYRLSVGTCKKEEIGLMLEQLGLACSKLT